MSKPCRKIIGLNTSFDSLKYRGFTENCFQSTISLFDYDAVIIDTGYISKSYPESETSPYQNKIVLSQYASSQIIDDFVRIKAQLIDMLKSGKNIYVLMGNNESCYIYTGEKTYSGTGKNARQTNMVTLFDTYSFLPVKINATHIWGEEISICDFSPFDLFLKNTRRNSQYAAYFSPPENSKVLAHIKGSEKVISAITKYGKGRIVFLPYPCYKDDYTSEKYWKENGKKYLDAIFELENRLTSSDDEYVLPSWTDSVAIFDESTQIAKQNAIEKKIKELNKSLDVQKNIVYSLQKYKRLLSATGSVLEEIVKQVLSEMGFSVFETEQGRSDIIAQYKDTDIVAEIKGVTKSAAEKHSAQLEKWAALFNEEHEHAPKAILIVNGFCDTPLQNRTEEVFPAQMLKYAIAREHLLLTTTQLLCLYIDVTQNPKRKDERIEELLSTNGLYARYNNYADFISLTESEVTDHA